MNVVEECAKVVFMRKQYDNVIVVHEQFVRYTQW